MTDATSSEVEVSGSDAATAEVVDQVAEVAKWKELSRKNEARAAENFAAAKELAELKNAGKSESERAAERIAEAEAAVAAVPSRIAESLRDSLVSLGVVSEADKVLLTASDPETLLAQVKRLSERSEAKKDAGNRAPLQGRSAAKAADDPVREFARGLFASAND